MLPLESRNVLICLRYGIGDLVMELPALTALRDALPTARITGIATAPAHQLLDGDPRVDRVVLTSQWGLRHRWDWSDVATRRSISEWVEGENFDLVLDAKHATSAVGTAIWSLGICSLEASEDEERAAVRRGERGLEAIRRGVRAGWGLEISDQIQPELRLRPQDRAFAADLLRDLDLSTGRPLAISPVASNELKRWPVERFAAVADHMVETGGGPVLVLEGPQAEAGRQLVAGMRRPAAAVRIGAHHLLHTAALLERCTGLVCNDTGLMHLSAAIGVPTVGVFGPTGPGVFLPPGRRTASAEPCGLECPHRATESLFPPSCIQESTCLIADRSCIHRTEVDQVLATVSRTALCGRGMSLAPAPSTVA